MRVYTVTTPTKETIVKKLSILLAPFVLSACVSIADAGTLLDLSVNDRNTGEKLDVYHHQGRLYVAGTPGNRYAVTLRNKSGERLLTVISVDGINALNGETAATSQSGYVIAPRQTAEIAGWRKSMEEVTAFYFTSVTDSYAGRTDRPQNVGVIGVAVYREAAPLPPPPLVAQARERSSQDASERPAANAAPAKAETLGKMADSRLGTGHGERIAAPTQYTEFRRASGTPTEVLTIHYDSRASLVARGIVPSTPRYTSPNPFPGSFTPDPRS